VPDAHDAPPVPAASGVRRGARLFGGCAVLALVAAAVLYAAAGPPYGTNIGAGVLYLLGLLTGLFAGVLLWLAWAEARPGTAPGRWRWGVGTAVTALVLVCACTVVSLAHVASGPVQLVLMAVTAAVLAVAVLLAPAAR
jgi:drug/metabolite transporter (DMT)-like permease